MTNLIQSALAGLVGAIIFVSLNNYSNVKSYGTIRLDEVISNNVQYIKTLDSLSVSEAQQMAGVFSHNLELSIEEISEEKRVILFLGRAVVSKIPDYTQSVIDRIESKRKEK